MLRILTQILIGAGFLAGGFFVGTQLATNPLAAVLMGAALAAAAIAMAEPRKRKARPADDMPRALEATA